MPLSKVTEGSRVAITCLPVHPALQRRLHSMGVKPGAEVEVLRRGRPGGLLHLAIGSMEFMLRREQAAEMQVSLVPSP